jgi:transcriptional regulator with XRE-family HTH domain
VAEQGARRQTGKRRPANITADQVIADQTRWLREQRGISQQRLADSLGWTQSQVARLELGKRAVTVSDLLALAWALDVAPVYLIAGSFTAGGDVPVTERLRVSPGDMRKWVRGYEPLPGTNYRRYFENIPDDEWFANRDLAEQRRELAEYFERTEELLESGEAEQEDALADERHRRRQQLDAARRTRKNS